MSFGQKRASYQLIGSKKAQIQTLRDHIKKEGGGIHLPHPLTLTAYPTPGKGGTPFFSSK